MIIAVCLDWSPAYLRCGTRRISLLQAPAGSGTVVEHIHGRLVGERADAWVIVPQFEPEADYEARIHRVEPEAAIVRPRQFAAYLADCELSDQLLLIDSQRLPADAHDLTALLRHQRGATGHVRHLVDRPAARRGLREQVVFDPAGQVRLIRRLYAGATDVRVGGACVSLLSVAAVRSVERWHSLRLPEVRIRTAAAGVPSTDIPARHTAYDLSRAGGLLRLNERLLATARPARQATESIRVGTNCRIDASARLRGPLVIHDDVEIGPGAAVVGPAVVGRGARIGPRAVVWRSVVVPEAHVPDARDAVGRVILNGELASDAESARTTIGGPGDEALVDRSVQLDGVAGEARPADVQHPVYGALKRGLDLALAVPGLLLVAPLMLLVAGLIKLTSRGPILFGHERETRGGRVFRCWKFRTMEHRAHAKQRKLYRQNAVDGPQFKMERDPRVTWLGAWLRKTNIDELPQLINVIRGDMSLIGPRPSPFRENQICVPWRKARLAVRPGITGLWQVCRHERSAGDFHQWIYFDMLYVRHMSLRLDLAILAATFLTAGGRWSVPLQWMIPQRVLRRLRVGSALSPLLARCGQMHGGEKTALSQRGAALRPGRWRDGAREDTTVILQRPSPS